VPLDSTGSVALTDTGVAVTVSAVPPKVTVGKLLPVHDVTDVVAHRPAPLIPIDVGVPEVFDNTKTELIDGALSAEAESIEPTIVANTPIRWFLNISNPLL
jgi:hypothetical protein